MTNDIKTIIDKSNGTRVRIVVDQDPQNPRDMEPLSFMKITKVNPRYFSDRDECPWITKNEEGTWCGADVLVEVPLQVHCHGGVSFSVGHTSPGWDNWACGVVIVTAERCLEIFGEEDFRTPEFTERIMASIKGEVSEFSAWANGEVYGFIAESIDAQTKEVIDTESGYGFYNTQDAEDEGVAVAKQLKQQPMLPGLAT